MIDNGSSDGSVEFVEQKFPSVRIVRNKTNLGLTAACNIGIREAKSDLVTLISNDVVLEKTCIEQLVRAITSSEAVGIVGGNIVLFTNPEIVQSFPSRFLPSCRLPWTAIPVKTRSESTYGIRTDIIGLCVMMIKKELVERIGLINEDYFMHFNEDDFSLKANRAGYLLLLVPTANVRHFGSATIGRLSTRKISSFVKGEVTYRMINLKAWEILPSIWFAIVIQAIQHFFMTIGVPCFLTDPKNGS
jgi:GT2 family glycosyltransferase